MIHGARILDSEFTCHSGRMPNGSFGVKKYITIPLTDPVMAGGASLAGGGNGDVCPLSGAVVNGQLLAEIFAVAICGLAINGHGVGGEAGAHDVGVAGHVAAGVLV